VDTEVQKLQLAQDEKHCLKLAREEEKLISSAEEQYKKVRAEHGLAAEDYELQCFAS
jgi:hypothetical protein